MESLLKPFRQKFRENNVLTEKTDKLYAIEIDLTKNAYLKKLFREINSLFLVITSLVKPMLSRNFCQKSARDNFRNFHTAVWWFHSHAFLTKIPWKQRLIDCMHLKLIWRKMPVQDVGVNLAMRKIRNSFTPHVFLTRKIPWKQRFNW